MEIEPYALGLSAPLQTASGTLESRRGFLVRVHDGNRAGVGEAAPLPGFTESREACRSALADAAAVAADDGLASASEAVDPSRTPAAAHGIDLARLDAAARGRETPLFRWLGGDPRSTVPVNATIGDDPPAATARAATRAVAAGFDCLKIKVGAREPGADVDRLRAVRDAVGPDIALRADANAAWSRSEARTAIDGLADAGVDLAYLEQPLAAGDLAGLADLRADVAVAVDETLRERSLSAVIEADAADAVVVKPMVHGSPTRGRALAVSAIEAGLDAVVTTTIDAVVARTAAVHVAASLPTVVPAGLATADRLAEDLGPDPAPVADGAVTVPQGSGLGLAEVTA